MSSRDATSAICTLLLDSFWGGHLSLALPQCQGFFADVIADLLLEQPDDPHEFMTKKLRSFPKEQKLDLLKRLQRLTTQSDFAKFDPPPLQEPVVTSSRASVQDTLRLVLTSAQHKDAAFAALAELKADVMETGKCVSFAVYYNEATLELLVLQAWATQDDLDAFVTTGSFAKFKGKWAGLLAAVPENRLYTQRVI